MLIMSNGVPGIFGGGLLRLFDGDLFRDHDTLYQAIFSASKHPSASMPTKKQNYCGFDMVGLGRYR